MCRTRVSAQQSGKPIALQRSGSYLREYTSQLNSPLFIEKQVIYIFRIYQFLIAFPLCLVLTILASVVTVAGCFLTSGRFWGYYPAKIWAALFCWLNFVTVSVRGRKNIDKGTSYVFVANHQGAFDIFSIYGFLGHNFKWMMKVSLRKIPFVGYACYKGGHIFVDKSTPSAVRTTIEEAEKRLSGGMSLVVFPEGARTKTGRTGNFKRGAYFLATEFGLPVVPITIDGSYKVLRRTAKYPFPNPGHITLTIHKPICASGDGHDIEKLMAESRAAIVSALPEENR